MQDFKKIKVWEKSHLLTLEIYRITDQFPKTEIYSLTNQMRRASTSIPTNIAEGAVQESDAQYARYLRIALGSAAELEYQLLLARDLKYIPEAAYNHLVTSVMEIKRMLTAFIQTLKADGLQLLLNAHS
jgi:four helix bundle protein